MRYIRHGKRILLMLASCLLGALAAGCMGKVRSKLSARSVVASHVGDDTGAVQTWHTSPCRVVVLFGYGYNDADFVTRTEERLFASYGAAEDGGLVIPLIFPDDFKRGKSSVATELMQYALPDDTQLIGMLLLGAGENTNYGVAHIQDEYNGVRAFPVFSLFSQDDVLGTEATSDFVLDRLQETNATGSDEESMQEAASGVDDMIDRCMERFNALAQVQNECVWEGNDEGLPCASLPWDSTLPSHVQYIALDMRLSRYVDGDTTLPSVNHFVIGE